MTPEPGGFIGLAALIVVVFARLRADMGKIEQRLGRRMDGLEQRMARLEGPIDGLRDSVTGRKDAA